MAVLLETSIGDITVDLFVDQCPNICKNFLKLCKIKYYNGCLFHSIQKDFISQTGDPTGTGEGGNSIYGIIENKEKRFIPDEIHHNLKHDQFGTVSMANIGKNTNLSQFFFTTNKFPLSYLDGKYTVFGRIPDIGPDDVDEGYEVLMKINNAYCDNNGRPFQNIRIRHTIILEDPFKDPPGIIIPDASPPILYDKFDIDRIRDDEDIDDTSGRSAEEIVKSLEEKEAKSRTEVLEMVGDLPYADVKPPENVLFVCQLNPVTCSDDLDLIFSRFGNIIECEVIRDWKTGDSLQYAFITFENQEDCEKAYFKMNNVLVDDRRIKVDFSQSVAKLWNSYRKDKLRQKLPALDNQKSQSKLSTQEMKGFTLIVPTPHYKPKSQQIERNNKNYHKRSISPTSRHHKHHHKRRSRSRSPHYKSKHHHH